MIKGDSQDGELFTAISNMFEIKFNRFFGFLNAFFKSVSISYIYLYWLLVVHFWSLRKRI